MFGLLPMPVPKITLTRANGRRALKVNDEVYHVTPGIMGCRPKFVLKEHGLIVKVDNAGASANGQWSMYHSVDPEDQPYFSIPVAIGSGWIAEVFYGDMEEVPDPDDYGASRDDEGYEWADLIDTLAVKYDITDWCLIQAKLVNGGTHAIIHDYADDYYESEYSERCDCSECV